MTDSASADRDYGAIHLLIDSRGMAQLTLNRPAAANSRNQQMRDELSHAYRRIAADEHIRVVVLTGAGDRHFCAGMDLKEAALPETPLQRRNRLRSARDIEQLARLPRPTIAAINGYALGGGFEMALACDLRIMSAEAIVGLTEIEHGLIPGGGATQRLPRLIGPAAAAEMLYLGSRVDGVVAQRMGLVNRVVPGADLARSTEEMAASLAKRSPDALKAMKEALLASAEVPLSVGVERELDGLLFLLAQQSHLKRSVGSVEGNNADG